jgi:uncharacterized membrane protein
VARSFFVNVSWLALALLTAAVVIGAITLWPDEREVAPPPGSQTPKTLRAEIVGVRSVACTVPGQAAAALATAKLLEGERKGQEVGIRISEPPDLLELEEGDHVRLVRSAFGEVVEGNPVERYFLADFERREPLLWLALAFGALVVLAGRWKGLRALVGLGLSLAVIVGFVVPAILDGASPPGVALVGSLAIMLATLVVTHGLGPKTLAAALGTAAALLIALGLGSLFIELAHLTGLSSHEALYLRATAGEISIEGLLLAGMVIGALGVLDDLTVSQASTVLALRRANPAMRARELFRSAVSVGQDHVAATVNTLVLAYAGAALPVLLVFSIAGVSMDDALNGEAVAGEVVATLVGSIGLVAAVPLTTGLATLLALRMQPGDISEADAHHGHAH